MSIFPSAPSSLTRRATRFLSSKNRMMAPIYFNKPFIVGSEIGNIQQAIDHLHLSGNGPFTQKCQSWLEEQTG